MTNTATTTAAMRAIDASTTDTVRLPAAGMLLLAQIRHQIRLLLANPRALVIGVGLPVILLVASKGKAAHPDVAGYAAFGLTITAWNTHGLRLVAARESGVLKRWRATPLPRWCYFLGSILATALVAVTAGTATVLAALLIYGKNLGDGPHTQLTADGAGALLLVAVLAAFAFAATATAVTSLIPTVESAFPTLMLSYFPLIIISGVLFSISEPHWLSTTATYLPAQPLIAAVTHAAQPSAHAELLPAHDLIVLACWAAAGLLATIAFFRWEPHRPKQRRTPGTVR